MSAESLDPPLANVWLAREKWFEATDDESHGMGSYIVSEHACALLMDIQTTFCAGAWVATVVLCACVAEATLREVEVPECGGGLAKLIDEAGGDADLHWLRRRRNAIVHVNPKQPALTVDDQWGRQPELEEDARRAVRVALRTTYLSPGT